MGGMTLLGAGRYPAIGGGAAATTWNPSDISNAAITGSGLIATLTATAVGGVRSIASVTTNQLVYWENTVTAITGGDAFAFGFSTSGTAFGGSSRPGASTPATAFYVSASVGTYFDQDSVDHFTTIWASGAVSGDTIDVAYNSLTGKVWFRHNNLAWNDALSTQDPSAGTGGMATTLTGSPSSPLLATFGFDAHSGNNIASVFSSGSWARTAPTGFTQLA